MKNGLKKIKIYQNFKKIMFFQKYFQYSENVFEKMKKIDFFKYFIIKMRKKYKIIYIFIKKLSK